MQNNAKKILFPGFITKKLFIQFSTVAHTQIMHKTFNAVVLQVY